MLRDFRDAVSLGAVAEWLCSGLQIRECRFDSGPCLQFLGSPPKDGIWSRL